MKREVWYDGPPYGPDILTQERKHDRWLYCGPIRKPLPGETADQFPKLLDPPKPRIHDPLEGFEV